MFAGGNGDTNDPNISSQLGASCVTHVYFFKFVVGSVLLLVVAVGKHGDTMIKRKSCK